MKAAKDLRKQAEKAERSARREIDDESSRELINLAEAFRAQADVLKQLKKGKKHKRN